MARCIIKTDRKNSNKGMMEYISNEVNNRIISPDYLLKEMIGENFFENMAEIKIEVNKGNRSRGVGEQGYYIEINKKDKIRNINIFSADMHGALYGIRDLYHYHLKIVKNHSCQNNRFKSNPAIKNRWLWSWDVGIHDVKKYLDMMSEWKYNGLVVWSSVVPDNMKDLIEYAHNRGIKIIMGFSWGYPDFTQDTFINKYPENAEMYLNIVTGKKDLLCPTNGINRKWIRDFVVDRYRKEYASLDIDGIYFQFSTESNRCPCAECSEYTTGELFIDWAMPIRDRLKNINPKLFISWGIHTWFGNTMFKKSTGKEFDGGIKPFEYSVFRKVPKEDQLLWEGADYPEKNIENTRKLLSIRGLNENAGLLYRIYGAYGLVLHNNNDRKIHKNIINRWQEIEKGWIAENGDWLNNQNIGIFIKWCRLIHSSRAKNKTVCHLLEGTDWGYYNRIVPMITAEIEWNPNRTTKDFNAFFNEVIKISDSSRNSPLYNEYKKFAGLN